MGAADPDEAEESSLSPTAVEAESAIVMHLSSGDEASEEWRFHPEFTHQAFPNEVIEGYEDVQIDIYINDVTVDWRVEVRYELAEEAESVTEIKEAVSKLVPAGTPIIINPPEDEQGGASAAGDMKSPLPPPGKEVLSYTIRPKDSDHDMQFVMLHAFPTDQATIAFHDRVQKLAPWFIETGDDVALTEGEWEMLYLFRREGPSPEAGQDPVLHLAGYMTVFSFSSPIKGKCPRVCQALILPPYQRQGHGQRMLSYVYELARQSKVVYEVTVEDPAPGFTAMRNLLDAVELQALLQADQNLASSLRSLQGFQGLSESDLNTLHRRLKLARKQIQLAFECLKYQEAEREGQQQEDVATQFRLMVKRRLAKECRSSFVVEGQLQKEQFQRHLDEAFAELKTEYTGIAKRMLKREGGERRSSGSSTLGKRPREEEQQASTTTTTSTAAGNAM